MRLLNVVHSEVSSCFRVASNGFRVLMLILVLCVSGSGSPAHAQETSLSIPDVDVITTERDTVSIQSLVGGSATVLLFWSNQCPWVDRYEARVRDLTEKFAGDGVRFILVNSNDASLYPDESVEKNAERVAFTSRSVPYVSDPAGQVAAAVDASRAPHAFVFDHSPGGGLVYTGAIDDSPAAADNVEEAYLEEVIDAVLAGETVPFDETKAFGCTLKSGN